ncbi:uncharacterized protein LOC143283668 [Babylonia areolata]|uniref:uncharacterized protein LOC143283668 n=1 Tax=Babylonia areolata TaxID=304850 RepID=UPI003FD28178
MQRAATLTPVMSPTPVDMVTAEQCVGSTVVTQDSATCHQGQLHTTSCMCKTTVLHRVGDKESLERRPTRMDWTGTAVTKDTGETARPLSYGQRWTSQRKPFSLCCH